MERKYRNAGTSDFYPPGEHTAVPPGGTFTTSAPLAHERALIEGGALKLVGKQLKTPCPACEEHGKARPPKFDTHDELVEHYASDHPGLVPPAGEEE